MPEHNADEHWLPVVGHEDAYEVSDHGRVRSLDRWVRHSRGGWAWRRGQLLTYFTVGQTEHFAVKLCADGAMRNKYVHRLVAEAFIGPCPEGMEVCHGPAGELDNRPDNLSYGTRRKNIGDRRRDGVEHNLNKTHCPLGHHLRPPNLVRSDWRRGKRNCLACHRGHSTVNAAWRRHGVVLDFEAEAARHYAKIIGTVVNVSSAG